MDDRDLIVFTQRRIAIRIPRGAGFKTLYAVLPWAGLAVGATSTALLLLTRHGIGGAPPLPAVTLGALGMGAAVMMILCQAALSPWVLTGAVRPAEVDGDVASGAAEGLSWRMLWPAFLLLGATSTLGVRYLF